MINGPGADYVVSNDIVAIHMIIIDSLREEVIKKLNIDQLYCIVANLKSSKVTASAVITIPPSLNTYSIFCFLCVASNFLLSALFTFSI
jgi:hypothetical protein